MEVLLDGRATEQKTYETEVGTTVQNEIETIKKHYTVDYLTGTNRDILVEEEGSHVARYVYDQIENPVSVEFAYAEGTARGSQNANGEYGENIASDIAVQSIGKVWYRNNHQGSTLYAVDKEGDTISHTIYDEWGYPQTSTYTDLNYSGLDRRTNYTGYDYDQVLCLYYAQNRFYDPSTHRFTQMDPIKDGNNYYAYVGNNPLNYVDPLGLAYIIQERNWVVDDPRKKKGHYEKLNSFDLIPQENISTAGKIVGSILPTGDILVAILEGHND